MWVIKYNAIAQKDNEKTTDFLSSYLNWKTASSKRENITEHNENIIVWIKI